jgi:hypothetical protein
LGERHKLSKYMLDIFVDVAEIGEKSQLEKVGNILSICYLRRLSRIGVKTLYIELGFIFWYQIMSNVICKTPELLP